MKKEYISPEMVQVNVRLFSSVLDTIEFAGWSKGTGNGPGTGPEDPNADWADGNASHTFEEESSNNFLPSLTDLWD